MDKGVKGVQLALKVLREYYAKDAAHQSADGAGEGIIGLLEAARRLLICRAIFIVNICISHYF